jgi:hypothetical protein
MAVKVIISFTIEFTTLYLKVVETPNQMKNYPSSLTLKINSKLKVRVIKIIDNLSVFVTLQPY